MAEILFIVAGMIACAFLTLQGWAITHLRAQSVRLDDRLNALASRLQPSALAPGPTAEPEPVVDAGSSFALPNLDGRVVTAASLLARGRPLVVMLTDPRCGPCFELLPDAGEWQRRHADRATIVLISSGTAESNRAITAEYGIDPGLVLLQKEYELFEALGAGQAPAALIIAPDGSRTSPFLYGAEEIRAAVANLIGIPFKPAIPVQAGTLMAGEPAPVIHRLNLDDDLVNSSAWRGETTVVLFWSPGCSHCQELLPAINAWDRERMGARLLVISRGPVALNREAISNVPVVLDDDRSLATAFGVTGTPAAVLINREGIVAAEVARGGRAVRSLLAYVARQQAVLL